MKTKNKEAYNRKMKGKNMISQFNYTCRQCSETFAEGFASQENAEKILVEKIKDDKFLKWNQILKTTIHVCNDGSQGLADLIGFTPKE